MEFRRGLFRSISLYALNIMHGARLKMADGKMAQLRLAASEEFGFLRIKAEIPVSDTPKPLTTSVPIFETALMADDHCDPQILTIIDERSEERRVGKECVSTGSYGW